MSGTQSQDGRLHLIAFSSLFYVVAPAAMVLRVRTVRHLAAVSFIAPISAQGARRGWWQRQCRGHVRFAPAGIRVGCKQPMINQIEHSIAVRTGANAFWVPRSWRNTFLHGIWGAWCVSRNDAPDDWVIKVFRSGGALLQ
jgi:hypothetical protein